VKYLSIAPSGTMVRQELLHSCGAACARQLLRDAGLDLDEATLRASAGYDPTFPDLGISDQGLCAALNEHHPSRYVGGTPNPPDLDHLASKVPVIVLVRTPARHWIIVDAIDNDEVRVRDPAGVGSDPRGASGTLERAELERCWRAARWGTVLRK
jgi:predicted double-glycine peptidase